VAPTNFACFADIGARLGQGSPNRVLPPHDRAQ
jgi:hypothetical protein